MADHGDNSGTRAQVSARTNAPAGSTAAAPQNQPPPHANDHKTGTCEPTPGRMDRSISRRQTQTYDAGLRRYLLEVYHLIALSTALAGVSGLALLMDQSLIAQLLAKPSFPLSVCAGLFLLGIFGPSLLAGDGAGEDGMDEPGAAAAMPDACFWGTAVVWGLALILVVEPRLALHAASVLDALCLSALLFAAVSRWALTTSMRLDALAPVFGVVVAPVCFALLGAVACSLVAPGAFATSLGKAAQPMLAHLNAALIIAVLSGVIAYLTQRLRAGYTARAHERSPANPRQTQIDAFLISNCVLALFMHVLHMTVALS